VSAEQAALRRASVAKEPLTIGIQPNPAGAEAHESGADDATLVARAVRDRAAFGLLYDRYAVRVFRYCYRRLGERELAEDATSQVFIKAMSSLPTYRETGSFVGWLFAIAFSTTTDLQRRRRPTEGLDDAAWIPDSAASPEEIAIAAEGRDHLRSLIADLPSDQRRAVELRMAGLTGAEVAAAMGRSLQSVKMLQFRAIGRLRHLLGADAIAQDAADDR
jgi:RNA polymerase sigma-70 factor (ECF subfamily)